ncbi:hypothetical protein GP486_004276 [Trichoglossum hirsutum]|uniref:Uncharacterized protein n=1 Tax=Trichoglossum hirsutum TaxID=265104 RepID=A0A9P8LBH7_9PEZI|nr:hypothetical protein GP486_004276 [Trichoglossum hirsutum]
MTNRHYQDPDTVPWLSARNVEPTIKARSDLHPRVLDPPVTSTTLTRLLIQLLDNDPTTIICNSQPNTVSKFMTTDINNSPAFNMGVRGLCGCTAIVLTNPNAVYMAHFWEDLSFNAGGGLTADQNFQNNVINFLSNGGVGGPSLVQHANDFNDPSTLLIVVSPNYRRRLLYNQAGSDYINQLVAHIQTTLPAATNLGPWIYPYIPVSSGTTNGDLELDNTAKGRLLFQFSPGQVTGAEKNQRIYFQTNRIFDAP